MKITKEFLDKAFSHESIKKHAYYGYELAEGYKYELSQKWVDLAYKHLTDMDLSPEKLLEFQLFEKTAGKKRG